MGVTYRWICEKRREFIETPNNKSHGVVYYGSVVAFAMLYRWRGAAVELVDDGDDRYYCSAEDNAFGDWNGTGEPFKNAWDEVFAEYAKNQLEPKL